MIKIPINATKLLGSKVTVDKTIEPVAKTSTESGYTKYRATSPLQPQGFELRVPNISSVNLFSFSKILLNFNDI